MKTQINIAALYLAVLLTILLLPVNLFSQKVIRLNNGIEYPAKIISTSKDSIRFELLDARGEPLTVGLNQVAGIRNFYGSAFDKEYLMNKVKKGKGTMFAGIGLLGTGIIMAVTGSNKAKDAHYASEEYYSGTKIWVTSIPFVVSGTVLSVIGGAVTLNYSLKLKRLSVDLKATPAISGVTVKYKF